MAEVFSAERIDPSLLNQRQLDVLREKLFQIHKTIFAGLDEKEFEHYVLKSPAVATRILLYRNKKNELIGYMGVHRFEKCVEKKPLVIFRAEVGLLPEYRQKDADLSFWLKEASLFKLLHPTKHVYFLYAPVSPSFYAMVARYTYEVYPRHDLSIPVPVLELMTNLAQQFGLALVTDERPLIRKVGWVTKATDQEKNFWQSSPNPHVRFYLKNNPGFTEGNGLLTLIPLTIPNTILSLFAQALRTIKKLIS